MNFKMSLQHWIESRAKNWSTGNSVIPGPYSALTCHFRTQYGFKTGAKEINSELCFGQNGCRQKVNSSANFYHHLSVCEKSLDFFNVNNPIPIPNTNF